MHAGGPRLSGTDILASKSSRDLSQFIAAGGAAERMPTMLRSLTPRRALSVGDEPLLMEQVSHAFMTQV